MPYLDVPAYVARFGERETMLLTNDTVGSDTYDSAKVEGAIEDAGEIVEGYLGGRYIIPIANPPRIVKGWTAAIAREKLFVTVGKVSQAVTDEADRARAQLKDAQAGRLTLPIATGEAAPEVANRLGNAQSSNDREAPTFAGTGALDSFTSSLSGGYAPCWRQGT